MTLLQRRVDQLGEAPVAVDDVAVAGQGDGAFLHLLDQRAIRRVGAAQRVDAFAGAVGDQERIDLAVADGPQRLFGLGQSCAQLLELGCVGVARGVVLVHGVLRRA